VDVRIAGGHGQIARLLTRQLADRGDAVHGIIRSDDQVADLESDGATPVVLDLETCEVSELTDAITGADAVVFAAGAGPGSGAERKWTVDHGAAAKLIAAADAAGVDRYVMISAMGTDDPPTDDEVFSVYLRAKARADGELMASELDWTVVRPGRLTDDPGTGQVALARHVDRGSIPREDVATVVRACLDDDRTAGHVFEVVEGGTPVDDALDTLTG
jgi:uncharacterized protein YbjT (DUF2867 family)